jgi:hypothetical protein
VILATIAGFYGVLAPTNAIADPSRNAGCRSAQSTQRWGKLGIVAYGQTRSFRYCWTGGLVMNSKVYAISGDANCWSNSLFQDQNCKGPTDRNKVPIGSSLRFSHGYANIYFWFQSRDCVTGSLNFVCAPWTWHGSRYTLMQGGSWVLADNDV